MAFPQLVVGGIIVDRSESQARVLAARRVGPPALAGRWEFPGGKVELGEEPKEALSRELREELSIGVLVGTELLPDAGETWPISGTFVMRLFVCEIVSGVPEIGASHTDLRWVSARDLNSLVWLDSDVEALSSVKQLI